MVRYNNRLALILCRQLGEEPPFRKFRPVQDFDWLYSPVQSSSPDLPIVVHGSLGAMKRSSHVAG